MWSKYKFLIVMCVNPGITHSKHWVSKCYNEDQILRWKSINVIGFPGYLTCFCVGYVRNFGILEDSAAY